MIEQKKCLGTISYMGGVPAVPEPFCWAWGELREYTQKALCRENEYVYAWRPQVSLHDNARNAMVKHHKGEWLFMTDTDMRFDPDLCARLVLYMMKYDLDVVTGVYCFKTYPFQPVLYWWNEETKLHEVIGNVQMPEVEGETDAPIELFELTGAAGGGCLLIRRRVFDKIYKELGEEPFDRMPSPNKKGSTYGEDHSFFNRCRMLGIKTHCAWNVHSNHLAFREIDPNYRAELPYLKTVPVEHGWSHKQGQGQEQGQGQVQ